MSDLFENTGRTDGTYSAQDIEVLEGLEPVRRRPGMYIGGTDDRALHHLVAEVLDNAMDEAVAGFASRIDLELASDGTVTVRDNGRGIPVDDHPKYPGKSALEVILTTLHSGGKFSNKVYQTSGGLHGVGLSVVNALTDKLRVEVARDRQLYTQDYSRGAPQGPLARQGAVNNRRGTTVRFHPDPEIFGEQARFEPHRLYRLARSKAYLFRGVEIRWSCDPVLLASDAATPAQETLHFPGGLRDYLTAALKGRKTLTPSPFAGEVEFPNGQGRVEWAVAWPEDDEGFSHTYCNTVPTPQGGTHEAGLRTALTRGVKGYGELTNNKRAGQITADDVIGECCVLLSVFIREPHFQGQTKDKLVTQEAQKLVEAAVKDHFDHWLSGDPAAANALLERLIEKAEERARRKQVKDTARKTATRRLRLPGKLADCSRNNADGTELFLVEGDSAGGSAKQARNRETQAILPLRGKILNVASASADKMKANQELNDLVQALGCGVGKDFSTDKLRYERVIIMTDADVDGAHIASLLMTFFYREMPDLIHQGHLYLALPPLYRLSHGGKSLYARDDAHKDELMARLFKGKKVDISRFKGLGEMMPQQLKETTMDPSRRTLLRVVVPNPADPEEKAEADRTRSLVESLMGRRPELRFQFIQDNAKFVSDIDV
ncbi:topoisomerase-4 subunit B [Azospirillum fermentarium]|uniref:DNA topoisomerase IV subunit B n=1 Tax=Azospirillum fermentarium TaxID=1233114 RepID=UPI0022274B74|nr:DNA topoisomerase IV subunit B [Azospirillum fermentarium]MCW2246444.1 topoisomerase-4 subunit B [Azospirillum fermentarium]